MYVVTLCEVWVSGMVMVMEGKYRVCMAPTIAGAANFFMAIWEIIEGLLAATREDVSY